MVLVCNSKKFIFIKPYLVGAKSIETQLQKLCKDNNDIIASKINYTTNKNAQKNIKCLKMLHNIFPWYCEIHLPLCCLFPRINKFYHKSVSSEYLKISVIKNPYILLIDFFWFYTDFIAKYYNNNGSVIHTKISKRIGTSKWNRTNIGFFYESKYNGNVSFTPLKEMFNKWIMSGVLEDKQTSKWEMLNELFYYVDENNKNSQIDFMIQYENMENDIIKLCSKLNIKTFKVKKNIKKPHNAWKTLTVGDYYHQETINYIQQTFSFSINSKKYTLEKKKLYIET